MMRALTLSVLLLLASLNAWALSCMPPAALDTVQRMAPNEGRWVAAVGTMTVDKRTLPPEAFQGVTNTAKPYQIPVTFLGAPLGPSLEPIPANITLKVGCIGPWCGSFKQPERGLYFFSILEDGSYVLNASACGGNMFANPSEELIESVKEAIADL